MDTRTPNLKVQHDSQLLKKKMKYLGVNLTKHIQDLYAKNYKMLIFKKSKMIYIYEEIYHVQGLWLNIVNMSVLLKFIYRFNAVLIQIPAT